MGEAYSQKISRYQTECFLCICRCLDMTDDDNIEKTVEEVRLNLEELPGQMALMCCYDVVSGLIREIKRRNILIEEEKLIHLTIFRDVDEFAEKLKVVLRQICMDIRETKLNMQSELVGQIRDYIEQNYRNPSLSLVEISEYFGYSSSHMSKIISQLMNKSFSELVSEKRLKYTKSCLIETDKTIAQIAQEAGYGNLSNFTRRFKTVEKMTPGQYRSLNTN